MYTEKELLQFAGKLAIACHKVLQSPLGLLSENIINMKNALYEYDNAIIQNVKESN